MQPGQSVAIQLKFADVFAHSTQMSNSPKPNPSRYRPTLNFIFLTTVLGLVVLLAGLFYLFFRGSQQSILETSQRLRTLASQQIAGRVERVFKEAENALRHVERQLKQKTIALNKPEDIEPVLYAQLLNYPNLTDFAFTFGRSKGVDADGNTFARRFRPRQCDPAAAQSTGTVGEGRGADRDAPHFSGERKVHR